eukprot:5454812-Amphidinium_carterae.1
MKKWAGIFLRKRSCPNRIQIKMGLIHRAEKPEPAQRSAGPITHNGCKTWSLKAWPACRDCAWARRRREEDACRHIE